MSDFKEERKDRERAQEQLEKLKKEKGGQYNAMLLDQREALLKSTEILTSERDQLKAELAQKEAIFQERLATMTAIMNKLKNEIERLRSERDQHLRQRR